MTCRLCNTDHEFERARFVCQTCGVTICWDGWHPVEQKLNVGEKAITNGAHPVGDDWCGYLTRQVSDDEQMNAELAIRIGLEVAAACGYDLRDGAYVTDIRTEYPKDGPVQVIESDIRFVSRTVDLPYATSFSRMEQWNVGGTVGPDGVVRFSHVSPPETAGEYRGLPFTWRRQK